VLIDDWRMWITPSGYTLARLGDGQAKTEYRLMKNNAVVGVSGANNDWMQDVSQITTAGGTAYIKGNLKINNTDDIVYENVSLLANQPDQSRSGWTCAHASREIYAISGPGYYVSADNPITCNKADVITKTEGSWAQSGTATLSSQAVNKSVTIANTDPMVAFNNIAWSVAPESGCGWTSSATSGSVNLAASGATIVEASQSGDCISNVQSAWTQYMTVVSDEIGQYIHQNLTITDNANTAFNIKMDATDFTNPSNYFSIQMAYSDPFDYNALVPISSAQALTKRQVSKGDVLTQSNGAASEGSVYERIVTVTCADACDKLSSVKLSVAVNDVNY
ncbi:MAG: hypothetical protein QXD77_02200, partial [Candidatus Aenigmatarchaeota archaeon]